MIGPGFPSRLGLRVGAALLGVASLAAQQPATPPPPAPVPAAPAPAAQAPAAPVQPAPAPAPTAEGQPRTPAGQSRPDFTSVTSLVSTDVIPRDGAGQFLADIKKEEFIVLEDGVQQTVASLTLVHGGRFYNLAAPPPAPVEEGMVLPPPRPVNDAAGRIFLLFVDDLHLDFRNTPRIRELFKKVSTTLIHDGDMFGIVSTGPSSLSVDLTYDRKRLDEAIKRISGSGLKPADILEAPQGSQGNQELRYRAHVAFSTASDLMRELEKVQNRRKALVFVSNGYDFDPFPQGRLMRDQQYGYNQTGLNAQDPAAVTQRQGQQFADADLARELADLTRAANRANVTIYTIDPRGLVGGAEMDDEVDMVEWNNHVRKNQDSLRVLAEETGGTAVINQNDFDRALKKIDAETSDYYVLGYYSSNPDPTRKRRAIEVKVQRPNVSVWARKGYALRTPKDAEEPKPKK
ncbi:MAG: VWA domain-containing protein [Acidobacteria bacterium]|nr:VWA domain-containing protein [Acidobacteriota bacterium]